MFIYIGIGVVITVIIICMVLDLEYSHVSLLVFFVIFFLLLYYGMSKGENITKYECIEGNLYMRSDNLINQNKKCTVHNEMIYQIEENGDLIKLDFQR